MPNTNLLYYNYFILSIILRDLFLHKINFSSANKGITIKGNGAQVLNLDIYNAKDNGIYITGSYIPKE
jgi:hypothetical protein